MRVASLATSGTQTHILATTGTPTHRHRHGRTRHLCLALSQQLAQRIHLVAAPCVRMRPCGGCGSEWMLPRLPLRWHEGRGACCCCAHMLAISTFLLQAHSCYKHILATSTFLLHAHACLDCASPQRKGFGDVLHVASACVNAPLTCTRTRTCTRTGTCTRIGSSSAAQACTSLPTMGMLPRCASSCGSARRSTPPPLRCAGPVRACFYVSAPVRLSLRVSCVCRVVSFACSLLGAGLVAVHCVKLQQQR